VEFFSLQTRLINVVVDKFWILDVALYRHFVIGVDGLCHYCFCHNLLNFLSSLTKVLTFSTKPKRLLIIHVTIILFVVVDNLYIYENFVIKTVDPEFFCNCLTVISVMVLVWGHSGTVFAGHIGMCFTVLHSCVP